MPVNFKGGLLVNGENVTTETEVETLQEELNTKAVLGAFNGGGTGVDYADLATNLRTEQGASVEDVVAQLSPISVAVGDGDFAEMINVKGRSFAYNQLVPTQTLNSSKNGITISSNNDGEYTIVVNNATGFHQIDLVPMYDYAYGHKYLITGSKRVSGSTDIEAYISGFGTDIKDEYIIEYTGNTTRKAFLYVGVTTPNGTYKVKLDIFDLTAMGIDTDDVDEAIAALRSYGIEPTVYNEYSAGKIIDTQPNKIISRGFNQWDEEWEAGHWSNYNGLPIERDGKIRNKNPFRCLPNTTYHQINNSGGLNIYFYDKNGNYLGVQTFDENYGNDNDFTTPNGAYFFNFSTFGSSTTTYNHDICISFPNPSLNGTYKPFVKDEHALTLPVMRSAGSVADDKDMVRVGTVDLGTFDWSTPNANGWCQTIRDLPQAKPISSLTEIPNLICSKFEVGSANGVYTNNEKIGIDSAPKVVVRSVSFVGKTSSEVKAAMSGVMLNYELAIPVAQDPTINLPQNIKVYNGGTLETQYESPNTTPALVSMLYQVNLKNFVEGVGSKEDINWDPQNIASKADVAPKANTEDIKSGELVARLADDLTPYSDASGAEQSNPFIINGTGTNNNTEIVTVGTYAFLKEKQGNTMVVNQLAKAINSTNWGSSDNTKGTASFNGGEITYSIITPGVSYVNGIRSDAGGLTGKPNHIYVLLGEFKSNKNGVLKIGVDVFNVVNNYQPFATLTTSYAVYGVILNATNASASSGSIHICTRSTDGVEEGDNFTSRNIILVDLTQKFDGNDKIPQDLLDNPSHFSWYYNGSLDRNTGSLENSNGVKLISTHRQLWDEEWELGDINEYTGQNVSSSSIIRSKNYIPVIPGKTHYLKCGFTNFIYFYDANKNYLGLDFFIRNHPANSTFIVPPNAYFMRFNPSSSYGTTYKNDITITPYYTPAQGGEGYDQYYPHEEPHVIDTGTEVLRSAGSARDYKEPNGTIHRVIGTYTFTGNETYSSQSFGRIYVSGTAFTSIIKRVARGRVANILMPGFNVVDDQFLEQGARNISATQQGQIGFCLTQGGSSTYGDVDALKAEIVGKTVYFELAEKTTEQGTSFNESLSINDYGMLYWLDENDELVGIPQGAKIFYPVNYKGFMDDLYSKVDGDSSAFVTHDEIYAKAELDARYALKEALGGTLRQLLATSKNIDFLNTGFVDLGTIGWAWDNAGYFQALFNADAKSVSSSNVANILCSRYKSDTINNAGSLENRIGIYHDQNGNNYIRCKGTGTNAGNNAIAFKEAMKGQLLAYEKA